jgi:hypothetical protein
MAIVELEGAVGLSGSSDVFIVNDNAGLGYRFAPTEDRDSWLSVDLWEDDESRERLRLREQLRLDETWHGAIGMVKRTDALLIGPREQVPGLDLRPFDPGRRGAWYSLGFLLRAVASRELDIGLPELNVGYSVRHVNGRTQVEVFLADALDNGAGYSTKLGEAEQLKRLLAASDIFASELAKPPHAECDSSCPDCLRDFTNLVFHPLLDWRLGRDLLDLHLGRPFDPDPWANDERVLAQAFAADFFGEARRLNGEVWSIVGEDTIVILRHPFEQPTDNRSVEMQTLTDRLDRGFVEAENLPGDRPIRFVSTFDLQRRPGWVLARLP